MIKLFSMILVICSLLGGNAMSANLKPLDQYLNENQDTINDPTVTSYLLTRCGALYTFVAAITFEKNRELADTFQKYSTKLLTYNALHMMKQFNHTEDEAFKSTNDVHKRMSKYYKEDGLEFFEAHKSADVHHRAECEKLLDSLSEKEQHKAEKAALSTAKYLWNFLSGMSVKHNLQAAA